MRSRSPRPSAAVFAAVFGGVLAGLLAGCGTAPDPPAEGAPAEGPGPAGPVEGFHSADCNGITDADVRRAAGSAKLTGVAVGDAGCFWQEDAVFGTVGLGNGISTWWYRGADLGEERLLESRAGRTLVEVTVDGHQGFRASDDKACSVYLAKGNDVMAWSLQTLNPADYGDLCAVVSQLVAVSHDRVN